MTVHNQKIQDAAENDCARWRRCFVAAAFAATLGVAADTAVFGDTLGVIATGDDRPAIDRLNSHLDENFLVEAKPNEKPKFDIIALDNVNGVFNRKIEVFGIPVFSYSGVSDEDLVLSANVLAQWLDNDENGSVDNTLILDEMADRNSYLFIVRNQTQVESYNFQSGTAAYSLDAESIQQHWYTTGPSGDPDGTMEESFHMISDIGYEGVYPDVFGRTTGTELTDAMDVARGGHFDQTPDEYPDGAWYTYDEQGCDYGCQTGEYFYWGMTSILGVHVDRRTDIQREWQLYRPELVESTDPALFALLTDPQYIFPTKYPDGIYASPDFEPSAIYVVRDDNDDAVFDDLGDEASDVSTRSRSSVGEIDSASTNQINRVVVKFALPELHVDTPVLDSATLRFFLEDIQGTPAGPLSVFHSSADNDLAMSATDYENPSYVDTLLDLVQPTDTGGQFYELDVTDQVLADYVADGLDPLSAFRLQVNEAVFFEDGQHNRYRFTMPGSSETANHPELILMFTTVPEPSTLFLAILGLAGLLAHGHRRRRA